MKCRVPLINDHFIKNISHNGFQVVFIIKENRKINVKNYGFQSNGSQSIFGENGPGHKFYYGHCRSVADHGLEQPKCH